MPHQSPLKKGNSFISKKSDLFKIFGWTFYLACSWTWCIGMFLPVILIRDYGPWGWVVFSVPNIVGACAMSYTLKKSDTSKEITEKHKIACTVFSAVTILFQIYFIGWLSTVISNVFIIITGIALLLIYALGSIVDKNQRFNAFIIFTLSLICFMLFFYFVSLEKIDFFKSGDLIHNTNALLYLTPVFFFGFLLCPYLDLTFHKVIQANTSRNSKIAFTIGFCFMFLLILLFTFFYARPVANLMEGISLICIYPVVFHMLIQAGFTIALHLSSVLPTIKKQIRTISLLTILSIVVFLLPVIFNGKSTFLNLTINDIIYRSFMAFYSLIAPAYVFLFMIAKNGKSISLNNYNLRIWIIVILLALPFYAIAFLGVKWNLEISSLIGLVIVLSSRILI